MGGCVDAALGDRVADPARSARRANTSYSSASAAARVTRGGDSVTRDATGIGSPLTSEEERARKKALIFDEVECLDTISKLPELHQEFLDAREARIRAKEEFDSAKGRRDACCASPPN